MAAKQPFMPHKHDDAGDGARYTRLQDMALHDAMRCPGAHPGQPATQNNWVQSSPSARHPLIITIDWERKVVCVVHEGYDGVDPWGEFFTPFENVKDFRVWREPEKQDAK